MTNSFLIIKKKPRGFQKKPLIIAIGRNVSKKATTRNLLKRRIRAIMPPLTKKVDADYTVIVRRKALGLAFQELKKEILSEINKNNKNG